MRNGLELEYESNRDKGNSETLWIELDMDKSFSLRGAGLEGKIKTFSMDSCSVS